MHYLSNIQVFVGCAGLLVSQAAVQMFSEHDKY
jgi:hypothetical protein